MPHNRLRTLCRHVRVTRSRNLIATTPAPGPGSTVWDTFAQALPRSAPPWHRAPVGEARAVAIEVEAFPPEVLVGYATALQVA